MQCKIGKIKDLHRMPYPRCYPRFTDLVPAVLHDPPLHLPAVVGEEDVLALAESGAGREAAEEAGPQDPRLAVLAHLHHQLQLTCVGQRMVVQETIVRG